MSRQIMTLTLADARRLIEAGEKKAKELNIPYNIAVVDAGGGLISHIGHGWEASISASTKHGLRAHLI